MASMYISEHKRNKLVCLVNWLLYVQYSGNKFAVRDIETLF